MAKSKTVTYIITAEVELDKNILNDVDFSEEKFVGEWIKVKSGVYENAVIGIITDMKKAE